MSGHSAEEIRASIKVYMLVFGALAVGTVITVLASYLHMPLGPSIALALAIATAKASLVALYFMHLKGEVRTVLWTLMLTALFFVVLISIPLSGYADSISINWSSWSLGH